MILITWTSDKKCLRLECDLNRFLICVLFLGPETLHPGNVFPDIEEQKVTEFWEFPGGPVVRTRRFHSQGPSLVSGLGTRIPQPSCLSNGGGEEGRRMWKINKQNLWTSLVVQWLRIRLPMQGTRVRALVREDPTCRGATKPVRRNYWACALKPKSHNYWAHVLQLLKPLSLEPVLRNKRSHRNAKPAHRNEE